MTNPQKTYIFCLDDHRSFSEDVKKRFSDASRYTVSVSHNRDDLLKRLEEEKDKNPCKVVIIGLHDSRENYEMAERLIVEVKKTDVSTGILLLIPPDKIEEAKKTLKINVDSYIPRNSNSVLRIHNTVKKLVSQHNLIIYRKRRTISMYVLLVFILLSAIFAVISYFRLPMYF